MVIVLCVLFTQGKDTFAKLKTTLSKVKKPSGAEANVLAKYFPSYKKRSESDAEQRLPFNPSAESVVLTQQKKKKAAIKKTIQKPVTIQVVLMKDYSSSVPKNKHKDELKAAGRIQYIRFFRRMSARDVKNLITRTFLISHYIVLECDDTGHNLFRSLNQDIDGEAATARRGSLYLCENMKVSLYIMP